MPTKPDSGLWVTYDVTLQCIGKLAASLPCTRKEIHSMLKYRTPKIVPEDFVPLEEIEEGVVAATGADGEPRPSAATFYRGKDGELCFEGRSVRGHIKDCATQIAKCYPEIAGFKAKLANKLYVDTDLIPLGVTEPHGTETRFIHTLTPKGPRSSYKYIDYVDKPVLEFQLWRLNDNIITEEHMVTLFAYGAMHGIGQERSQGWGRYTVEMHRGDTVSASELAVIT